MGVGVDQTRHEHFALAIKDFMSLEFALQVLFRAYCNDGISPDGQGAWLVLGKLFVHSQNQSVHKEHIGRLRHESSGGSRVKKVA